VLSPGGAADAGEGRVEGAADAAGGLAPTHDTGHAVLVVPVLTLALDPPRAVPVDIPETLALAVRTPARHVLGL
jgi:hypothetical protein